MRSVINRYYDIQKMRIQTENQIRAIVQGKSQGDIEIIRSAVLVRLEAAEADIVKYVKKELKKFPIYNEWLKDVKGIGPVLAAGLIGYIEDPAKFDNPAKLWAYAGLHVIDGKAARRTKGQKANWNSTLKTICWLIGESFVKTRGPYRDLYDQSRKFYDEKFPEHSKGHNYAMAKRKTVKIFLVHFYNKWREVEGLPEVKPYVIEKLGHKHEIPAP